VFELAVIQSQIAQSRFGCPFIAVPTLNYVTVSQLVFREPDKAGG
jgi:hypothetical protein